MIRGALRHLPGIGPERLNLLHQAGICSWDDLRQLPAQGLLSAGLLEKAKAEIDHSEKAIARNDIHELLTRFHPKDHWRIAAHYLDSASFFDIETAGLSRDSEVTLIVCLHQKRLHTFVRGENLEGFLTLLDEVKLLLSFNGSSFDVPRLLHEFHIPLLPCPHVDLRWICHHQSLRGGLKSVERELGMRRPPDLVGTDGAEAVWLWQQWVRYRNPAARDKLVRYCQADVLALRFIIDKLVEKMTGREGMPSKDLWHELEAADESRPPTGEMTTTPVNPTGTNPLHNRLQARWQLMKQRSCRGSGG